jgi:YggT family protein
VNQAFLTFVDYFMYAFTIAIFGRIVMSFVSPHGQDAVSQLLFQITEPILGPIRNLLPQTGFFDLSPLVALLAMNFIVRPLLVALA